MSVALKRTTVTREQLRAALSRAVESGQLDVEDAYEVMAAYDAGTLDRERIAVLMDDDDQSRLVTFAAATALAIVLTRQRAAPVRWRWNPAALQYQTPAGEVLHPAMLRRVVDVTIDRAGVPMRAAAPRVVAGDLPLAQWNLQMEEWIAERHIAAAAAARGGVAQLTDADKVWIRERILTQYDYLTGFEADLRQARQLGQPLTSAQVAARIELYNQAARATFEESARRVWQARAGAQERRLLGVVEQHCPVCLTEARRGWVPVGTLRAIGDSPCIVNCRCGFVYRQGRG